MSKEIKEIQFSEVQPSGFTDKSPLRDIIGQKLRIVDFEVMKTAAFGDAGIIKTEDGKQYYTFSEVIIRQLSTLKERGILKDGNILVAKIARKKRYITLE